MNLLAAGGDAALLLMRASVGAFLVWGVWDNITSAEHMGRFVSFLKQYGFVYPELRAVRRGRSVPVRPGLHSGLPRRRRLRLRGQLPGGHRDGGPSRRRPRRLSGLVLVAIGLVLATVGPGRFALDRALARREFRPSAG